MDRLAARALGLFAATAVVAAAGCQLKGSGYQYVRDADTQSYFKVPEGWVVEEPEAGADTNSADDDRSRWFVTFRAGADTDAPAGIAQVLGLTAGARESISFQRLNGLFYAGFDEGLEDGTVTVQRLDDVVHLEGFHGRRLVYTVAADGGRLTVDQTTLLDDETRNLYAFMIRCTVDCYDEHKSVIDEVVASWTVKER